MNMKSLRIKKTTSIGVFYNGHEDDLIALSLLCGLYNPLRKHSPSVPIDLEKLKLYQDKLADLLFSVRNDMDVNVRPITEL